MAPFDLAVLLGDAGSWLAFLGIGFAFGFILESSGFGDSRRLAGQFYFTDLAVLQVMFTAVAVCMVLLFWAVALGWLDYHDVWVNPTYLWPGILGGLVMGFGFVLGGYCPGTSLVSMATLKLDGMFFVGGVATGIYMFGDTVQLFYTFWHSSNMGRFTLPEWLGLETGVVVFLIVCLALFMFWGAGRIRRALWGER